MSEWMESDYSRALYIYRDILPDCVGMVQQRVLPQPPLLREFWAWGLLAVVFLSCSYKSIWFRFHVRYAVVWDLEWSWFTIRRGACENLRFIEGSVNTPWIVFREMLELGNDDRLGVLSLLVHLFFHSLFYNQSVFRPKHSRMGDLKKIIKETLEATN